MTTTSSRTPRHPSQWRSAVLGLLYAAFGVAGLASLASVPFAGPEGIQVAGFRVNGAQGIIALAIAAGGLLAFTRLALAARYGWALVVVSFGSRCTGPWSTSPRPPTSWPSTRATSAATSSPA